MKAKGGSGGPEDSRWQAKTALIDECDHIAFGGCSCVQARILSRISTEQASRNGIRNKGRYVRSRRTAPCADGGGNWCPRSEAMGASGLSRGITEQDWYEAERQLTAQKSPTLSQPMAPHSPNFPTEDAAAVRVRLRSRTSRFKAVLVRIAVGVRHLFSHIGF